MLELYDCNFYAVPPDVDPIVSASPNEPPSIFATVVKPAAGISIPAGAVVVITAVLYYWRKRRRPLPQPDPIDYPNPQDPDDEQQLLPLQRDERQAIEYEGQPQKEKNQLVPPKN
jgi:hypothetical protein